MKEEGRRGHFVTEESKMEGINSLTIHGVPKIFTTKSYFSRVLWALLCTSTVVFLIYFMSDAIRKHLNFEIYIKEERIPKHEMSLPAITICNTNFYSGDDDDYAVNQVLPKNCSYTDAEYFETETNRKYFLDICHWFHGGIMGEFSPKNISFPQNASFLPNFWPCVTLNKNKTMVQKRESLNSGLKLLLIYGKRPNKTVPWYGNEIFVDERQGLFVTAHDQREVIPAFSGISLPPGYHTIVKLRKKVIRRKESPYPSNCIKSGQKTGFNVFSGKARRDICLYSCLAIRQYNICHAIDARWRPFMNKKEYPNTLNVTDKERIDCMFEVLQSVDAVNCKCNVYCDEEVYETQTSRVPWPQQWKAEELTRIFPSLTSSTIRQTFIKLTIYYEEISEFRYTEEEKYSIMNVWTDFGGQMGLFIGASLISFVEILLLLLGFLQKVLKKKKNIISSPSLGSEARNGKS
ncbi:acid-sensing ion channel 4-A-like [Rhopilema esculentum]|uniref:acid-sensing ion channel 4-A-like n=1 Tax=Rhopilema esculentum TaxID=499914 RepID=UPI0031D9D3CE|eukprot:gene2459-18116_t